MSKSVDAARKTGEQPASPFEQLGGEAAIRLIVDCFYDIMDQDPAAAGIRAMHGG